MDMSVSSSSNSSLHPTFDNCLSRTNISILTAMLISYILLLPLFILVLYVGYQPWRKQRSVATAAMTSHSDMFTFNMVFLELIGILGLFLTCYGAHTNRQLVIRVGMHLIVIVSVGQNLFHLLTCVERYLAVVHPITYLWLRQAGGVRIRNISLGCVWLLCFGSMGLSKLSFHSDLIHRLLLVVFSSIVVCFCNLSVLCILIRPGPGEVGGNRDRVDQSKQRAFHTMTTIMVALMLRFLITLVLNVMYASSVWSCSDIFLMSLSALWFSLPSSLVLPLLFLHRAGKLPDWKHDTEKG